MGRSFTPETEREERRALTDACRHGVSELCPDPHGCAGETHKSVGGGAGTPPADLSEGASTSDARSAE